MNWKVLEHVPLLLYILAAKTLILCLAFAGVKMYQRRSLEGKLQAEKRKQSEKKATGEEGGYCWGECLVNSLSGQ